MDAEARPESRVVMSFVSRGFSGRWRSGPPGRVDQMRRRTRQEFRDLPAAAGADGPTREEADPA
ncbi:MAG TPA: hypothetical protein VF053_11170 [Streptosporangiales bacterium]